MTWAENIDEFFLLNRNDYKFIQIDILWSRKKQQYGMESYVKSISCGTLFMNSFSGNQAN